ncbi:type VI secretion system baseplate subunit TssE [Aliiroseovarius sp. YM-037]|uniref:type VI secretion system baseplate subunit TssE n=1 Tax=Aliiroseovarius sp. YM-037 TaxID=3341728 RepID=UPI003A80FD46
MPEIQDLQSRREAVQPSLWDRLVDDLAGLTAESDYLLAELGKDLGEDRLAKVLAGGPRAIEQEEGLKDDTRKELHHLSAQLDRARAIQASGIVVTADVLREAVRRDIEMLFNIERLEADFMMTDHESVTHTTPEEMLASFPHVRRSVVNFGVPSFAGKTGSDFDRDRLARELRDILAIYEPRLKRESIKVKVEMDKKTGMRIALDAVLMLSPVPERLRLATSIDLDNGQAVTEIEDD